MDGLHGQATRPPDRHVPPSRPHQLHCQNNYCDSAKFSAKDYFFIFFKITCLAPCTTFRLIAAYRGLTEGQLRRHVWSWRRHKMNGRTCAQRSNQTIVADGVIHGCVIFVGLNSDPAPLRPAPPRPAPPRPASWTECVYLLTQGGGGRGAFHKLCREAQRHSG